jgi:hypothetical protein
MPTTSPDSIYYADGTTPASLADITSAMATSIQNALNVREMQSFSWANSTAKSAQTGMIVGDIGYQIDNLVYYRWDGSAWKIWAKAPAAYTPTISGVNSGFVRTFMFSVSSGMVNVVGKIVFNSGLPTGSGTLLVSLPSGFNIDTTYVVADTTYFKSNLGGVSYWDDSASVDVVGSVSAYNATTTSLNYFNTATAALGYIAATRTAPFSFLGGDSIQLNFSYPVA